MLKMRTESSEIEINKNESSFAPFIRLLRCTVPLFIYLASFLPCLLSYSLSLSPFTLYFGEGKRDKKHFENSSQENVKQITKRLQEIKQQCLGETAEVKSSEREGEREKKAHEKK